MYLQLCLFFLFSSQSKRRTWLIISYWRKSFSDIDVISKVLYTLNKLSWCWRECLNIILHCLLQRIWLKLNYGIYISHWRWLHVRERNSINLCITDKNILICLKFNIKEEATKKQQLIELIVFTTISQFFNSDIL